jgi:Ca-activated chloride channel homolog
VDFSQFHFSQGAWLWGALVVPIVFLLYALFFKAGGARLLERFADRQLLPHLVRSQSIARRSIRVPLSLWALAWLCGVVAMAGPRWSYTDEATFRAAQDLVVVLDLSQSMNATDVKPSRIARAREEIEDLLNLSRGVSIGLVAYAAVPHMVTPLTDDTRTIKNLLPALDTSLVTIQGDRLKPALEMAANMLRAEIGDNKSILVISDGGFQENNYAELAQIAGKATIYTMGIGATGPAQDFAGNGEPLQADAGKAAPSPLKADRLQLLAKAGRGFYVEANYTDSDTRAILDRIEGVDAKTQASPKSVRVWDERFYIPALILALLLLPLFRRGVSFPAIIAFAMMFFPAGPSRAATAADLFLNRDQQAQAAYDKGDYKGAMTKFDTPYQRGVAAYRAGAYDKAAVLFKAAASQKNGLNAYYDLGNAQLMQGQVENAIASYETVLKQKPGHVGARHNLAIALEMQAQKQQQQKNQQPKEKKDKNGTQNNQQSQQQQRKNGQQDSQGQQSGAPDPSRAKEPKGDQPAKQQPAQPANSQQTSPQGAKQAGPPPQNQRYGMSSSEPPRTQRDINADQWLGRVQSDPGSFLKNQFMIEDRNSGLKQSAPPG